MNLYTVICRLRGPAYILLTGVIAMMAEWTSIGWGKSWPLYIVLEGVLQLAQRWALSRNPPAAYPGAVYPAAGSPYAGVPTPEGFPGAGFPAAGYPAAGGQGGTTAIVPSPTGTTDITGPHSSEWRS